MDTPTTVMSSWDAPNNTYDRDNKANETSVELNISSVQTADSGDYMCSASVTDSSDSVYVVDSDTATDMVNIIISKSLATVKVLRGCVSAYFELHSETIYSHRAECDYQCKLHCSSRGGP